MAAIPVDVYISVLFGALLLTGVYADEQSSSRMKEAAPNSESISETSTAKEESKQDPSSTDGTSGKINNWRLYVKVFEQNRAVQLDAVKTMQKYGKYEERYKLAEIIIKQLFKVLGEAKVNITQWGYLPGGPFPEEHHVREGVSKALENTAMFGDLALRLPDIVHKIYDSNREWKELISWGVWFCNQSQVFELSKASAMLLNLMSQELNLVERDPNYINPFTDENIQLQEDEINRRLEAKKQIKEAKKKKREKKRGPRMSSRVEL